MASIRVKSIRSQKDKMKKKRSKSKKHKGSDDQDIISRLKDKNTLMIIGACLVIAFILQQANMVTLAIDDDIIPSCSIHDHCQIGKNCVFGKCYSVTPDYPEIGRVTVHYADGAEVLPDVQGFYRVPARKLMFFEVTADNDKQPFNIEVYSNMGLGQKGLDQNRKKYFAPILADDQPYKNLYWVRVEDQERDFKHRFYFELIAFPSEKFNMFVYLKNVSEVSQGLSEVVEVPVRVV